MASTDSLPVAKKNTAFRLYFTPRTSAGAIIATLTNPDSEVAIDGANHADCTNEAVLTTRGRCYIDLTSSEMNCDGIGYWLTCDELPDGFEVEFAPEEDGDIRVNLTQLGGTTQSATDLKDFADTGYDPATHKVQGVVTTDTATTVANLEAQAQADVRSAVGMGNNNLDTQLGGIQTTANTIDGNTQSIRSTVETTDGKVDLVAGYVDTEVAAIKAKTDLIPSSPAAVGSAMTLADGAITDAKFTIPTLTTLATGPVGMLVQVWRFFFKKRTQTTGDSAQLKTYANDGTTVVTTQDVDDDGTTTTVGGAS